MSKVISFDNLTNMNLTNDYINIHQYTQNDKDGLTKQFSPNIFKWFIRPYNSCEQFIEDKLSKFADKEQITYIISDKITNEVIGTFSFASIDCKNKSIEISSIWFGTPYVGRFYNTMTNFLTFEYLFEVLGFNRIQWKTDKLNIVSQNAALSLGFTQEGTLRKHIIKASGQARDTVMFSIIDDEWADVKPKIQQRIQDKLNQFHNPLSK